MKPCLTYLIKALLIEQLLIDIYNSGILLVDFKIVIELKVPFEENIDWTIHDNLKKSIKINLK